MTVDRCNGYEAGCDHYCWIVTSKDLNSLQVGIVTSCAFSRTYAGDGFALPQQCEVDRVLLLAVNKFYSERWSTHLAHIYI